MFLLEYMPSILPNRQVNRTTGDDDDDDKMKLDCVMGMCCKQLVSVWLTHQVNVTFITLTFADCYWIIAELIR